VVSTPTPARGREGEAQSGSTEGGLDAALRAFSAQARSSGTTTRQSGSHDVAPKAFVESETTGPPIVVPPLPLGRPPRRATPSAIGILAPLPDGSAPPKYTVEAEIGRGGMGRVLKVFDTDLKRTVAMKVLGEARPQLDAVARFLEEAQVNGKLEHPGIVPIHELGVDEQGRPYFTMKLLSEGKTLADVIDLLRARDEEAHRRFSFDRRSALIQQLCQALAHAHSRGIVHRDIKPSNILVGPTGEVYLFDWGIAVEVAATPGAATPGGPAAESTIVGTPAYMSPEQARGLPADPRSDLYSLSAVLYELLTLHHYLGIDTTEPATQEQLQRVLREPPLEAETHVDPVAGRIPRMLSRICRKGLAKDPADRYQSALELEVALQGWQEGCGPVVCPGTALQRGMSRSIRWIDRWPFAAPLLAYVLLALAAGGIVGWVRQLMQAFA
jgi:serine/threonine protein kinase